MPDVTCQRTACKKEFYSKHSTAKYCSRRCANTEAAARRDHRSANPIGRPRYTDEELIQRLVDLAEKLGRTPSRRECPAEGTLRDRFGSYNKAVVAAGLVPNTVLPPQYLEADRHLVPLSMRYAVLCRDRHQCQYCGGTPQQGYVLQVDHRKPRSQGGLTVMENLVTACWLCNSGKSNLAG